MDGFELLARSEWPAVVVGGMFAFHEEIRHVLKNIHLRKVKAAGVEADFEQGIENAERLTANLGANLASTSETQATLTVSEAPDAASAMGYVQPGTPYFPPTFIPSVQVTSAWTSLMAYMKSLYDQDAASHSPPRLKWREPGPVQDLAAELGLTPAEVGALTEMEALNHRILTSPTPFITGKEAQRYQKVISSLQKKMKLPEAR